MLWKELWASSLQMSKKRLQVQSDTPLLALSESLLWASGPEREGWPCEGLRLFEHVSYILTSCCRSWKLVSSFHQLFFAQGMR